MKQWIGDYMKARKAAHDSIPTEAVAKLIEKLRVALQEDRQVFVFGNGGSAANASHFATDLGKGASDKVGKRFRVLSLNDNVSWMTALANDYAYDQVFVRQLQNFARAGDIVLSLSVSGGSPNCVKASSGRRAMGCARWRWWEPSVGGWRRWQNRQLSSTTHITDGWKTRRWASATCFATRSWRTRSWARASGGRSSSAVLPTSSSRRTGNRCPPRPGIRVHRIRRAPAAQTARAFAPGSQSF